METETVWAKLSSASKLERDSGGQHLTEILRSNKEDQAGIFVDLILSSSQQDSTWEAKLGLLSAATIIAIETSNCDINKLTPNAINWLSDEEVRVRKAAGEFLGALCQAKGPQVYEECRDRIFRLVQENTERAFEGNKDVSPEKSGRMSPQEQIFHDTAGWRNLETSVKCLQSMVEGCGSGFRPFIDQPLLDLIFVTLKHQNRFVRETGYQSCASIIEVCIEPTEDAANPVIKFSNQFAAQLAEGMADNWSQVRRSAAMATRQFLLSIKTSQGEQASIYALLLPRLCLNRYYLAEGVRIFSQKTWELIVGPAGKEVVERHIGSFVNYYISCTQFDNHAVREAACQCIAELAAKINPLALEPFVDSLLQTLLGCFEDESWPVRDMACVACGSFVLFYPEASRHVLPTLKGHFFANLTDAISSVRQGAAQALAKTAKAYTADHELVTELKNAMLKAFGRVQEQPVESHKYGDLSSEPANFGVAKRLRDNDPELHENQTMFSCGSLAPKMGRGGGGGCGDCKFRKPSEPWEAADGYLYLASELASVDGCAEMVASTLPKLEEAVRHKHYTMHFSFLETLAKVLPTIGKGIGKRLFKPHLEGFFDSLFYACAGENALAAVASQQCLKSLAQFLGPNILKGRVEQHNPRFIPLLEESLDPASSGAFMPFPLGTPMDMPTSSPPQPSLGGTPTGSPH